MHLTHCPEAEFSDAPSDLGLVKVEFRFIVRVDLENQLDEGKKLRAIVEKFNVILLNEIGP